jgi:hypothetical protein
MPKQYQYCGLDNEGLGDQGFRPKAPVIFPFFTWSWRWWPVWGSSQAGIRTCLLETTAAVCNGCFETVFGMGDGKFEPQPPNGWEQLRKAVREECPACASRCPCNSPIQDGESCFRCSYFIRGDEDGPSFYLIDPQTDNARECNKCLGKLCEKLSPGDLDGKPRWFGKPRDYFPTYRVPDMWPFNPNSFDRMGIGRGID